MSPYVLDSSAIIALIKKEPGSEVVMQHLNGAIMSSVNFSETITVLARKIPQEFIIDILNKAYFTSDKF